MPGDPIIWSPPFRWPFANDLNLPHVWNIAFVMGQPFQRGADVTLLEYLVGAALYTWREAFIGFVLGSLLGLLLATVFVHSGSPSARSCPTSSPARRSRSSPSRR